MLEKTCESLQPGRVDREDQRIERHDQRQPALVVEMAGAGFRHRPQAPAAIEGDALDARRYLVFALDLSGCCIEAVEFAPAQIAARDPQPPRPVDCRAL